jgi:nicotinamide-nucleotide amidase
MEMAAGALAHSHAQVAVAVTGIAGPGGGTRKKPVGTVCFAWSRKRRAPESVVKHFRGSRGRIRRRSVAFALQGLLERLEDEK